LKKNDIDFEDLDTGAKEIVENYVAREFEVSSDVIHRRIEKDDLWQ
jgi:hypothetical protein